MKLITSLNSDLSLEHSKNFELTDQQLTENNDPLFHNQGPLVYLSIKVDSETQLIKAKKIFDFGYKKSERDGTYHAFVLNSHLTHKEKNIQLFAAGLFLLATQKNISLFLGSMDVLGFRIRNSHLLCQKQKENGENDKALRLSEDYAEEFQNWNPKTDELLISETSLDYLKFAELNLESARINKNQNLKSILEECFKNHKTFQGLKIVGAN